MDILNLPAVVCYTFLEAPEEALTRMFPIDRLEDLPDRFTCFKQPGVRVKVHALWVGEAIDPLKICLLEIRCDQDSSEEAVRNRFAAATQWIAGSIEQRPLTIHRVEYSHQASYFFTVSTRKHGPELFEHVRSYFKVLAEHGSTHYPPGTLDSAEISFREIRPGNFGTTNLTVQ